MKTIEAEPFKRVERSEEVHPANEVGGGMTAGIADLHHMKREAILPTARTKIYKDLSRNARGMQSCTEGSDKKERKAR